MRTLSSLTEGMCDLMHALTVQRCARASLGLLAMGNSNLVFLVQARFLRNFNRTKDLIRGQRISAVLELLCHRLIHHILRLRKCIAVKLIVTVLPRRVMLLGSEFCRLSCVIRAFRVQKDVIVLFVRRLWIDHFVHLRNLF